jgi:DNA-binding CsgD family transcriptional regulator
MGRTRMLLLLFLAFFSSAQGQESNLGIPPIRNFPKAEYRGGAQTWEMTQDRRGVMYFANNEGLLEFDGNYWELYPIDNKTILRSIAIDTASGKIYAGGQGEIGYFFPDNSGRLRYHSLLGQLPESARRFEDVWEIIPLGQNVFFRTKDQVFRLNDEGMESYNPGGALSFMGQWDEAIWVQSNLRDLLVLRNGKFEPWRQALPFDSEISAFLPFRDDTLLIATLKNGIFFLKDSLIAPWTTGFEDFFRENRIYCAASLPGRQIALGTSLRGVVVMNSDRTMHRALSRNAGIQNNNVLSVFSDRDHNLWLGLDNGIDCVEIHSPVSMIYPDEQLEATGYTSLIHNERLYLGASNGLYSAPWNYHYNPLEPGPFKLVKNAGGQVWGLNLIGQDLLLGRHEGASEVNGQEARPISNLQGAWMFIPLGDDLALGGAYSGLSIYEKTVSGWRVRNALPGLEESCRIITRDKEGPIWVSHPYRGVYRVTLGKDLQSVDVKSYQSAQGLPSDLFNYVFQIGGKTVVAAEKGVYQYNASLDRFEPDTAFHAFFSPDDRVKYLREDDRGNIWFAAGEDVGVLRVWDEGIQKRIKKQVFPALKGKLVGGFEHIYPHDSLHVFLGTENGFILFQPNKAKKSPKDSVRVILREVRLIAPRDSLIFRGLFSDGARILSKQPDAQVPRIPYPWNSLRFVFSASDYGADRPLYRHRLDGFDSAWSDWQSKTEREFTNLRPGAYTFQVESIDSEGNKSEALSYSFEIAPPWYGSPQAKIGYVFFGIVLLWVFIRLQRKRFESEKAALTSEHRQKEAHALSELDRIENEKLEGEIAFKNRELASATMHLVQKGKMMLKLQDELNKLLRKYQTTPQLHREIQRILNIVANDNQLDEDWRQFAYHFDQVYIDFQKRLQALYPQLSPNDLKLCSYLRMNLTSKEIASLMNISLRGVEASRYRLRKKLNLPTEANLIEYIMRI